MLGGHSADDHSIRVGLNPTQLLQVLQINQMLRPSQSELHHRDQAVSAGDDPRVFTVVRQKPERLVERAGPMIGERRGYHSRSPARWSCSFFLNPSRGPIQHQLKPEDTVGGRTQPSVRSSLGLPPLLATAEPPLVRRYARA